MRIAIILNGISRRKRFFASHIYPLLKTRFDTSLFETTYAGHAKALAEQVANQNFDVILSAGGDGTLNQVLNGMLLSSAKKLPVLGLIPLGSANDFARSVGITASVDQLLEIINNKSDQSIDIGEVTCRDKNSKTIARYFINACSLGMGPLVVERLEKNRKKFGPSLSYLSAILTTFFTHKPQPIKCKADLWEWEGRARVAAFANGVSFGNGIYIAPDAKQNDGKLNSFIAEDVPLWRFLIYLQTIKMKKQIKDPQIKYSLLNKLEITSGELCCLEAEGEIIGYLPAIVEIKPKAIQFLVP
jgi:diacylglycerol kinase (ATP)